MRFAFTAFLILFWSNEGIAFTICPANSGCNRFFLRDNPSENKRLRSSTTDNDVESDRKQRKQNILKLLGSDTDYSGDRVGTNFYDLVLSCPETKEPLLITSESPLLEGGATGVKVSLRSKADDGISYQGRTDTFYNLLQPSGDDSNKNAQDDDGNAIVMKAVNALRVFIPPPLRMAGAMAGVDDSYVPMRDLFTSPAVSFAYERGWRQGFAAAGFPGADEEFELVQKFFQPITFDNKITIVDMSCATGLFTRRLAKSGVYSRVLGCDYSESMLMESRRRIQSDPDIALSATKLELVQCDVAKIPMQSNSVDAFHAGAAMHCWPEIDEGLSEIYRVLKSDGGRFFATTFLAPYFRTVISTESKNISVQQQAFQYFESVDVLKEMIVNAGFKEEDVTIEVLGTACVVIRCVKN